MPTRRDYYRWILDDYDDYDDEWTDKLITKEPKDYIRKDIEMTKDAYNIRETEGVEVILTDGQSAVVSQVALENVPGRRTRITINTTELNLSTRPTIKDVIFNPPATIVFWSDNTKTVVKADGEFYDPEKGIAMAIARKMIGDNKREYYNVFKHYLKKWDKHCKDNKLREYLDSALDGAFEKYMDAINI